MRMQVVKIVDRVRSSIGLLNVLHLFNISIPTYKQWSLETFTSCFYSMVNRCNRIYPTQLSSPEIDKLKEKLCNVIVIDGKANLSGTTSTPDKGAFDILL